MAENGNTRSRDALRGCKGSETGDQQGKSLSYGGGAMQAQRHVSHEAGKCARASWGLPCRCLLTSRRFELWVIAYLMIAWRR